MSTLIKIDGDYALWIKNLSLRFRQSQIKAAVRVNCEIIKFYYSLGADIVSQQAESKWGDGFFKNLSQDLQDALPGVKGFSETNLRYAKYFFLLYKSQIPQQVVDKTGEFINHQQPVEELPELPIFNIPWGHHVQIIGKCKGNTEKALFYVNLTAQQNWSRAVLQNFLDSNLYERQGKAITNFKVTLPEVGSDLAQAITKDPYCFDFAELTKPYHESELKDKLLDNIEKFLLELGKGFAYMGREYRLQVGQTEQYIDMLFYNVDIHAYVVLECKTTTFEPSDIGQLGTYVVAVDHQLRKEGDNKTIGLLVCKTKDDVMARYALESSSQPLGVSAYELSRLIPENFRGSMPSIEEIENELR